MQQPMAGYPQQQYQPQPGYQQQYQYPQAPGQQPPLPAAQPTHVIQQVQPALPVTGQAQEAQRPGFDHVSQKHCGIVQIVIGAVLVVLAVIMIVTRAGLYQLGFGIWTSVFFFIAGGLGVQSAKTKNTCPIVGCMVMSIFSIFAAICVFSMAAGGLTNDQMFYDQCKNRPYPRWSICDYLDVPVSSAQLDARIAMNVINIILGVTECFAALAQSIICCRGTCCGGPRQQPQVIIYQPTPQVQAPVVQPMYQPQQMQGVPPQQQPYYGAAVPVQPMHGAPQHAMPPQPAMAPHAQYPMQGHPAAEPGAYPPQPPVNPDYAMQASAPPSYDEVTSFPPKQ